MANNILPFKDLVVHRIIIFVIVHYNILPFKDLVVHRIGIQMFQNNLGLLPNAVENFFTADATVHSYNTRNRLHFSSF